MTRDQDQADFVRRFILKLDRAHRHDRRDRVLIDQLRLAIAAQQHAEIVEPGDIALKLHAIDQKDRDRGFAFADGIEKRVLQILLFFAHCFLSMGFSHFYCALRNRASSGSIVDCRTCERDKSVRRNHSGISQPEMPAL